MSSHDHGLILWRGATMYRLKRLCYYVLSTALATLAAYDFFSAAATSRGMFWTTASRLLYVVALSNYVYSLVHFTELVLGRPIKVVEGLWSRLHDKPVLKCVASLILMAMFFFLLAVPVVAGAVLSGR